MTIKRVSSIVATSAIAALVLASFACSDPPPTVIEIPKSVEVTREVPVTVEVEREIVVTREVPATVVVDREVVREIEVPVVVQIPVTVEVEREATREVEITREVEVTREIEQEVTREVPVTVVAPQTVEVEVTRVVPQTVEVEVVREQEMVTTLEIQVTREVTVEVEVTREVQATVEVEVTRQTGGRAATYAIFAGMNQASLGFCKDYVSETDTRTSLDWLDPINVALSNMGDDDELEPVYLWGLVLNALNISLAGYDYPDDEENDWQRFSSIAENILLYDYCVDAVVYAEDSQSTT